MPAIRSIITKGFSLIELMIVISILAIVAALAIPAYGDYVIRTKVSGMINAIEVIQEGITEYRQVNGEFTEGILPDDPVNTFVNIGVTDPSILTPSISQIVFAVKDDYHMSIIICGNAAGQGTYVNDTVDIYMGATYTVSGMVFDCSYSGNSKYVPTGCRKLYDAATYGIQALRCVH